MLSAPENDNKLDEILNLPPVVVDLPTTGTHEIRKKIRSLKESSQLISTGSKVRERTSRDRPPSSYHHDEKYTRGSTRSTTSPGSDEFQGRRTRSREKDRSRATKSQDNDRRSSSSRSRARSRRARSKSRKRHDGHRERSESRSRKASRSRSRKRRSRREKDVTRPQRRISNLIYDPTKKGYANDHIEHRRRGSNRPRSSKRSTGGIRTKEDEILERMLMYKRELERRVAKRNSRSRRELKDDSAESHSHPRRSTSRTSRHPSSRNRKSNKLRSEFDSSIGHRLDHSSENPRQLHKRSVSVPRKSRTGSTKIGQVGINRSQSLLDQNSPQDYTRKGNINVTRKEQYQEPLLHSGTGMIQAIDAHIRNCVRSSLHHDFINAQALKATEEELEKTRQELEQLKDRFANVTVCSDAEAEHGRHDFNEPPEETTKDSFKSPNEVAKK